MSQEENQNLQESITKEFIEIITKIVNRELEAKIPEIEERIKSELREEIELEATTAALKIQEYTTRQSVINAGLG